MKSITFRDIRITSIGHSAFRLNMGGVSIYTDPFQLPAGMPPADIILVTHDHYDHCDANEIAKIVKADTIVIAPEKAKNKLRGIAVNVRVFGVRDGATFGDIRVKTIPAYNTDNPYHPRGAGVSYIIETPKTRVFFSGDTDFVPEMKELKGVDLAFVPLGAPYTMDEKSAAEFVNGLRPGLAIPMHYGVVSGGDPYGFKKRVDAGIDVEIM